MLSMLFASFFALSRAALATSPFSPQKIPPARHHHAYFHEIKIAHAVLASLAWAIFFPLGAIMLRLLAHPLGVRTHMTIQLLSYTMFVAAAGLGIWMARITKQLHIHHCVIGLLVLSLAFIQAVIGYLHHRSHKLKHNVTFITLIHIWLGRALTILAVVNGGLGLLLAGDSTKGQQIVYGVIAALMWFTLMAMMVWAERLERTRMGQTVETETENVTEVERK